VNLFEHANLSVILLLVFYIMSVMLI